jgi:hypothetical protein
MTFPFHDDWPAGVPIAQAIIRNHLIPNHRAAACVERNDVGIGGIEEDLVTVDGERAHTSVERGGHLEGSSILPQQLAGLAAQRLNSARPALGHRLGDVHDAVVDERRRLADTRRQGSRPDQLEASNILRIQLIERAVAPPVQRAAPV